MVRAKSSEYEPVKHCVHDALPTAFVNLYVPATQALHDTPSGPVKPEMHLQSVCKLLPRGDVELPWHEVQELSSVLADVVEYFPNPHCVQTTFPVTFLYVPATHSVHDAPPNPRSHEQFSGAVLPALELKFSPHDIQVDSAICAVPAEYLPVPHEVHETFPDKILNVPAGQAVQVSLPSTPVNPGLHLQAAFAVFVLPTATVLFGHPSVTTICVFIVVIVAPKMTKTKKTLVIFRCDMLFLRVRIDTARIYIYIFAHFSNCVVRKKPVFI